MKNKELIVGIVIGFVLGITAVIAVLNTASRDREPDYVVLVMNEGTALKLNKRSGETWVFSLDNRTWVKSAGFP